MIVVYGRALWGAPRSIVISIWGLRGKYINNNMKLVKSDKDISLIYEQLTAERINEPDFSEEITVNGELYYVEANFDYEEKAVDYVFNPRAQVGADVYAQVPYEITSINIATEDDKTITDENLPIVKTIKEIVLDMAENNDRYYKDAKYGKYGKFI